MAIKDHGREYDLIVFGATGYTGKLTAEHITTHLPTTLKWALAGRSEGKLQVLVDELKQLNPDRVPPSIETANIDDFQGLKSLTKKTFVLITTVGPYGLYGEYAFQACAENGTHYLDVTGETPWTRRMVNKYTETARASGALMFPQIGIESSPPDLCTWLLAKHVRETMGVGTRDVTVSLHKIEGHPSGGTFATAFGIFDYIPLAEFNATAKPYSMSPVPHTQKPLRPSKTIMQQLFGIRYIKNLGLTTTSVAAVTDTPIIERTWGLLSTIPSRKNEFYGPNFHWREVFKARNWLYGIAVHLGLFYGTLMLAFIPWFRTLAKKMVYQPGEGRTKAESANEMIEYRGIATPDRDGETRRAFVKAAFRDGGMYYLTGIFLAQAAMTILEEDLKLDGGVYTPACLGQGFIDRCGDAGFKMQVETIED